MTSNPKPSHALHDHARTFDADVYDESYFTGGSKSGYDDYDNAKAIVQDQHHIINVAMISNISKTTDGMLRSLDIGCAYGHGVEYWARGGFDAAGLDISEFAIDRAKQLYGHLARFEDGDAKTEYNYWKLRNYGHDKRPDAPMFDIITACELFEHIATADVDAVLTAMAQNGKWGVFCVNARTHPFQADDSNHGDHGHLNNHFMQWWISKVGEYGIIDFDAMLQMSRASQDLHPAVHWQNRYIVVKFNEIKE